MRLHVEMTAVFVSDGNRRQNGGWSGLGGFLDVAQGSARGNASLTVLENRSLGVAWEARSQPVIVDTVWVE